MQEECGINAEPTFCGYLLFLIEGSPFSFNIHIYRVDEWSGEPTECVSRLHTLFFSHAIRRSEEMLPKWFALPDVNLDLPSIPFDQMWPDDVYWLPLLLNEQFFRGRADFKVLEDGTNVMRKWWFGKEQRTPHDPIMINQ